MSLQIRSVLVYGEGGRRREVAFRLGALNVLTGGPRTGKSSLLDVVDYCLGRDECTIAEGAIRRPATWFAVLLDNNCEGVLIARRNPRPGHRASDEFYCERGLAAAPPTDQGLAKNTTGDAVKALLGRLLGISENEHLPPAGQTRPPMEANARHALLFCLQAQDEIASRRLLFHRQGEPFMPQTIKDSLPYFLGAVDEDRFRKQRMLDDARRRLRRAERRTAEARALDEQGPSLALSLLAEAATAGLAAPSPDTTTRDDALRRLRDALGRADDAPGPVAGEAELALRDLEEERARLRAALASVREDIRDTASLLAGAAGFEREAREQRARLSAIGLVDDEAPGSHARCPVCESELRESPPGVTEVREHLRAVSDKLALVHRDGPRVQERLALLHARRADLEDQLRQNQRIIAARVAESERLRSHRDGSLEAARVAGRISLYLESVGDGTGPREPVDDVSAIKVEVEELERALDSELVEERVATAVNLVGRFMSEYAGRLAIEHGDAPLRLDSKHLTVVADTIEGPIALSRMGSGENWVGYHIIAHLALHKLFRIRRRPVPAFLLLDQPSQAHYPPERDEQGDISILGSEDQQAVRRIFNLLRDYAAELAPGMQVIVVDHVDIKEPWFQDAVVERWRAGRKFIPDDWLR